MMGPTRVGTGSHRYEVVPDWAKHPAGTPLGIVTGVATDSQDRVYVYGRGVHPVMVFDANGAFIGSWGEDFIRDAHGITITRDDTVLLVDRDAHQVLACRPDGAITMRLGRRDEAAHQAPFNHPTAAAAARDGTIYVSDGYANSCIHAFSASGEHVLTWGRPGTGPGEFRVPHHVWVDDRDRVLVCDRDNFRVQSFDRDGTYRSEWADFFRPTSVFVDAEGFVYVTDLSSRLSVYDGDDRLVTRIRLMADGGHSVWADSRGDLYVVEIHAQRIDKYVRRR
jgi:sugar lactone lactonase YvrE